MLSEAEIQTQESEESQGAWKDVTETEFDEFIDLAEEKDDLEVDRTFRDNLWYARYFQRAQDEELNIGRTITNPCVSQRFQVWEL